MPRSALLLFCALLATACAPRRYSAALGNYDAFQPYAMLRSTSYDIELARAAHVAIIAITPPAPGYNERPVLFRPLYPLWDTDRTQFTAGKHRVTPRRQTLRDPVNCRGSEKPTLRGCRRAAYLYPGAGVPGEVNSIYSVDLGHYLVIASEDYLDAFTLADELFDMVLDRSELAEALKTRKGEMAAADLERALLDRPGSPLWGALYVAGR